MCLHSRTAPSPASTESTISVQGANGVTTVAVADTTTYQQTKGADASAIAVGDCVRITGTGSLTKGITAFSIALEVRKGGRLHSGKARGRQLQRRCGTQSAVRGSGGTPPQGQRSTAGRCAEWQRPTPGWRAHWQRFRWGFANGTVVFGNDHERLG